MPNVPNAPGVPPLSSFGGAAVGLLIADAVGLLGLFTTQWGIFDQNGNPVLVGDSVKAFEYDAASRIANFPIEQGGFASYNKVALPYNAVVVFNQGGTIQERSDFLAACEAAKDSLDLFTIVTPEVQYQNANVVRYAISPRTNHDGVTMLTVSVYCEEVRPAPPPAFSSTKDPSGMAQVNDGTVQPTTPASPPPAVQ